QGGQAATAIIAANPDKYAQADAGAVEKIIDEVLATNPKAVEEYKGGKTGSINFLKGQVMKQAKGKANPAAVDEILKARLG
ncbi:MAG: Asp-tRNA(Asn)/Glu-tRNA(Gln) amidotransferase GatCAB subunit B, partial [Verrucomicrobiae bacterium]|nr:Asp-tRNA(Asn)/Glu-tRNA(Gln) amidotransferase GatCAB subunit B [Verrucomicrobiae bacterium]